MINLRRQLAGALALGVVVTLALVPTQAVTTAPSSMLALAEEFRGAGPVSVVRAHAQEVSHHTGRVVFIAQLLHDSAGEFLATAAMTSSGNIAGIVSPRADGGYDFRSFTYTDSGVVLSRADVTRAADPYEPVETTRRQLIDAACGIAEIGGLFGNVYYGIGSGVICMFLKNDPRTPYNPAHMNWDGQVKLFIDYQEQTAPQGDPYAAVADFWVKPIICRPAATTNECKLPNGNDYPIEMSIKIVWPSGNIQRLLLNCLCNYRYYNVTTAHSQLPGLARLYVEASQVFPLMGFNPIAAISRVYNYHR